MRKESGNQPASENTHTLVSSALRLVAMAMLLGLCVATSHGADRYLNINFGDGTNKTGTAAVGVDGNDVWNYIDKVTAVSSNYNSTPVITWGSFTNFAWHDDTDAPIELFVTNLVENGSSSHEDAMLDNWLYVDQILVDESEECGPIIYSAPSLRIDHLPAGTNYALYIYANGDAEGEDEGFRHRVNGGSWSSWEYTTYEEPCCPCCPPPFSWTENERYVVFTNITINTGDDIEIEFAGNGNEQHMINGIQIKGPVPLPKLPDVAFSPVSGTPVEVNVTLSVPGHSGTTIYYTTDGSTPTTSSSVYSSAINLTTATTVKSFATKANYDDSDVSSATYPLPTLPDVSFSPASGGFLPATVTLSVTGHGDATIYYTTDGSTPTTSSSQYSTPISLTTSSWEWTADQVPTMTDWNVPSASTVTNSSYESSSSNYGWKAMDASNGTYWRADWASNQWISLEYPSDRVIAKYSIRSKDEDGPKDWTFEGWTGSAWSTLDTRSSEIDWYVGELREFVCTNNAAHTKYRLNVAVGNASSSNEGAMITIAELEMFEARSEIKTFAAKSGYNDSDIVVGSYHATASDIDQVAPRPTITPSSGDHHNDVQIAISSALSGASYQWSTNGTDWNAYSAPINDSLHPTIIAYTTKSGYVDSPKTTNSYTFTCAATDFDPLPGHFVTSVDVTLANDTENATLHYTTDGSTPTTSSATYSSAIQLTATTTIKVLAVESSFQDSVVAVGTYTLAGVNGAPSVSVPGSQTLDEDVPFEIDGISVSDADAEPNLLELSLRATNGFLTVTTTNGLTILEGENGVTTNLLLKGRLEVLNVAVDELTYQGSNNFNGTDLLMLIVDDLGNTGSGGAKLATNTISLTIDAVNDPPDFTLSGDVSVVEDFSGTQTVTPTPTTVPTDETGQTNTWFLSSGVAFADVSISETTGVVTITGIADGFGTNTFEVWALDDGGYYSVTNHSFTLEVSAVNDAPVLTLPASQSTDEDTLLAISGVSVADADIAADDIEITLISTNGVLAVSPTTGLTFTEGTSGSTTNLVFTGSITDVNNSLAGLSYDPDSGFFGDDGVHVEVDDLGGNGSGVAQSDSGDIAIVVYASATAPAPTASPLGGVVSDIRQLDAYGVEFPTNTEPKP